MNNQEIYAKIFSSYIDGEIWKQTKFAGYEVSNLGRVRSFRNKITLRDSLGRIMGSKMIIGNNFKILKPQIDKDGYFKVRLYTDNGKSKRISVHTLVLEGFVSSKPNNMVCCHNDGNSQNNILSNLRWATQKENEQDKFKHGTDVRGCKNGGAKLINKKVINIRKEFQINHSLVDLMDKYQMSRSAIYDIVHKISWKNI